ncbi:MAG TPA: isoprenylcysteine carboxylmethyltransferase family protein [Bacteroidota bacterium]|nr:isoprenylcysteine carboxylmethyltransferase family protein [Bacteroidota bacterium]
MSRLILSYAGPFQVLLLLLLGLTGNLFSGEPLVIAGQILGLAVTIYARIAFGRQKFNISARPADGPLLRRGPYRVIRHPMYAGVLLIFVATVFGHPTLIAGAVLLVDLIVILWRIRLEEGLLKTTYPDYEEYTLKTTRLIPFIY